MVASTNRIASQVGCDILKRGGNAVDAAIATAFTLAVVYPEAGNLGGGGFMMVRTASGTSTAIDYRETAPQAASRNMYLNASGELIEGEGSSTIGYRAAGVPGTVAGMARAFHKYGSRKLTWAQLIEPSRRLALNGFPVSQRLADSLRLRSKLLNRFADSRRIFLRNGRYFGEGELLRQPELASTLARLQKKGAREFYEGQTAQWIAADMRRNKGTIALQDLHTYIPKERVPVQGIYRGHTVISMPPPSSGGVILLQMLNILEGYDLPKMNPFGAERYHLLTEAMRRSFADRAAYFGDTDFVTVPINQLMDKGYAAKRRGEIDLTQASTSQQVGAGMGPIGESNDTTHFTVVDSQGNAVSNTYTLNGYFGSGVVAKGTGVLLNNEMDDFTSKPGSPNLFGVIQSPLNSIEPRKRPLSSMSPTFVLHKDGKLWFAIGSPGGPTIINTVFQVTSNIIDHGMNLQEAIDAPRVHHQWLPDEIVYEPLGLSSDTQRALEALGHRFASEPRYMGDAQGVMIEISTDMRLGASDARQEGVAIGY
jgi:gamma-glutamyltranspeptidase/glutathione hydrolase